MMRESQIVGDEKSRNAIWSHTLRNLGFIRDKNEK
jgi:hypothetical protein